MRLRRSLALGATAAVTVVAGVAPAPAAAKPYAPQPTCDSVVHGEFPIGARIVGGPGGYEPGGGFRRWGVELGNDSRGVCANIHPVVVIVDRERELRPRQIQLEFHDGTRWRPVRFERTDRDENVGVFGDGGKGDFPGFTVGAGKRLTVKVRLSFTSDARSERAVVSAAIVQRRDDDGDWVGESRDYPFAISEDGADTDGGRDGGGDDTAGADGGGREGDAAAGDGSWYADELAATGAGKLLRVGAVAVACFLGGWGLMVGARRFLAGRRR
ncbi:hypothetical protein [Streptomyces sp. MZ04]|uniref:hypothetical protein n=1 Tax=Streptomyces sp. MZ04 TaxID=2559236 RepID=UPI00107E8DAB|nr:hypothetical protein [Streptomyces sp. MZ04]TGB08448.1 hypothetical protein E2651_19100 [Streptomyces sp. MZ04]